MCQQDHVPSEGCFLASSSFRWPQYSLACGHVTPVSASAFTWMSAVSLLRPFLTPWIWAHANVV